MARLGLVRNAEMRNSSFRTNQPIVVFPIGTRSNFELLLLSHDGTWTHIVIHLDAMKTVYPGSLLAHLFTSPAQSLTVYLSMGKY